MRTGVWKEDRRVEWVDEEDEKHDIRIQINRVPLEKGQARHKKIFN